MEQDIASAVFGVRGAKVIEVDTEPEGGMTVWLATDNQDAAACPDCAVVSTHVRERVLTRPRDVPLWTSAEQFDAIIATLERDEHGRQILLAWIAKEKLRDLIRLRPGIAGAVPTREQIRHALYGSADN